jgi:predicted Zn finger-like uncharacterized protein
MILTCPSCGTQYVVKDGAIPPGGRQVRCAACKHSWHQNPEEAAEGETETVEHSAQTAEPIGAVAPEEDTEASAEEQESLSEATLIEPRSGPEAEERAYEEATLESEQAEAAPAEEEAEVRTEPQSAAEMRMRPADWQEPPQAEVQDDEFSPFPAPDEVEPRRRNPVLAISLVVIIVIAIAAAFWFLAPPDLKARLGIGDPGMSPLALVTTHMDRQRLESGQELLTVTGRIINPTGKEQDVPPLQAQLKTRAGKVVYSWTIAPPVRSLAPGTSASFNSAELKVPSGGDELTITLGGPQAG